MFSILFGLSYLIHEDVIIMFDNASIFFVDLLFLFYIDFITYSTLFL